MANFVTEKREQFLKNRTVQLPVPEYEEETEASTAALSWDYVEETILGNRAVVIHGVLTSNECVSLINFIESLDRDPVGPDELTLTPASSNIQYRSNKRIICTGSDWSELIYSRIAPVLAEIRQDVVECNNDNANNFLNNGFAMRGVWKAHSLNNCFRLCKYDAHGHFAPHYDSDYIEDPVSLRSLKTCMIYLNDDYQDGETNFVHDHDRYYDVQRHIFCSPSDRIFARIKACSGDCLIFDHKLLHEGNVVSGANSKKYIMRSEIMYCNEQNITDEPSLEAQASRLLHEGMELEADGNVDAAISCYKRAYKLCPHLDYVM